MAKPLTWTNKSLAHQWMVAIKNKTLGNRENCDLCTLLQEYLTNSKHISFQLVEHKLKHLTFWSKHISSRAGPWHRWESVLVLAREKNSSRAWLSTFSPSAEESRSLATKPVDKRFLFCSYESTHPGNTEEPALEENPCFVVAWRPSQNYL